MAKRMLIDATHPEETRVVVLNGTRLEEFDFETSTKKQIRGNIYLAKVTRVEPSLQAAFVEYGGNRHGFLAFSEIHPDYYRIPVSDRDVYDPDEYSVAESATPPGLEVIDHEDAATDVPSAAGAPETSDGSIGDPGIEDSGIEDSGIAQSADDPALGDPALSEDVTGHEAQAISPLEPGSEELAPRPADYSPEQFSGHTAEQATAIQPSDEEDPALSPDDQAGLPNVDAGPDYVRSGDQSEPVTTATPGQLFGVMPERIYTETAYESASSPRFEQDDHASFADDRDAESGAMPDLEGNADDRTGEEPNGDGVSYAEEADAYHDSGFVETEHVVETVGGDEIEENGGRAPRHHHYRNYKVQEVIKRRQILLVQVTKEERGNKGAALTTYLSLAGRYCVLMPNAGRGGGVSRKITSVADRRRLKELMEELQVPEGMGMIVRTAGSERSKAEIYRDYEYLLRLWDDIRELTLKSSAPDLIYEEGTLIKRAIRDLYSRDIDEILVEGEEGYRTARNFMQMLMPGHVNRVKLYRDPIVPLFHRYQVDIQIDQIHNPVVQLRSGGYIVINTTEALVAIDVNSGRSTRERNIEETATKTNLEAAEEVARQLRLRDLAGLIVIDFIDMEEQRNQASVEKRLKEAMRNDRARIQLGRISPFGLLELSRQRLRSSLIEASTQPCPHCNGTGTIRSVESAALVVLRALEEEGIRRRTAEIVIAVHSHVALYILNHKRDTLSLTEQRYGFQVLIDQDDSLVPPSYRMERVRALTPYELSVLEIPELPPLEEDYSDSIEGELEEAVGEEGQGYAAQNSEEGGQQRRKKRRRKRRRGGEERPFAASGDEAELDEASAEFAEGEDSEGAEAGEGDFVGDDDESGEAGAGDLGEGAAGGDWAANGARNDENAERRRRRRGRRGGRRRGNEEPGSQPAHEFGYPPVVDFARDGREALFGGSDDESYPAQPVPQPILSQDGDQVETSADVEIAAISETAVDAAILVGQPTAGSSDLDLPADEAHPTGRADQELVADPQNVSAALSAPELAAAEITPIEESVAEPARKPRAPRRRRSEPAVAAESAPSTKAEEIVTEGTKPKRTRRPRATKAEVANPSPEEGGTNVPPEEKAAVAAEESSPPEVAQPVGRSTTRELADAASEPASAKEDKPRRVGWWRRLVQ